MPWYMEGLGQAWSATDQRPLRTLVTLESHILQELYKAPLKIKHLRMQIASYKQVISAVESPKAGMHEDIIQNAYYLS